VTPAEPKTRRSFLGTLAIAIGGAVGAVMAIPLIRFATWPMRHNGGSAAWFPLGAVDKFADTTPVRAEVEVRKTEGWRATVTKQTVWVTHDGVGKLRVLSAVCTHLGCIVPWKPELKQFVCPCHHAFYSADGAKLSGPQPRGLDSLPIKVENGTLFVKYQYFRQLTPKPEVIG